jgi:ATP-dependent DNA helicase DinG
MTKTKDLVSETFEADGLLAKEILNYKVRPQQVELSHKIQKSIQQKTPLIAEAPTGVGKSLASLVPAFEHIKKTDEPVVVTTSSIILQEQYINKDIPMLEKLYNHSVSPVLIKGRNNYLCPKKLNELRNGKVGFSTSEQIKESDEVMKWAVQTKTGDKSELDFNPSYPVWGKYACLDNSECNGKQCSFFNNCHYYRERKKIDSSKLVVTNYHYFFSALESPIPMLPDKAKVVVMDEGHEISTIARDFQERKYHMSSLKNQFDRFATAMKKAELSDLGDSVSRLFDELELDQVNASLVDVFVGLRHEYKKIVTPHYTRDFWMIEVPHRTRLQKYVTPHIEALVSSANAANRYLNKYGFSMENIRATEEIFGQDGLEWFVSVFKLMEMLEEKASLLNYMFAYDESVGDGDDIFWIQPYNDSVSVHAKPTTGANLTRELFQHSEEGFIPIIMSATLSANQSFEHLKEDLGADSAKVNELIVSSPFELEENMLWWLPEGTPAGNDPGHIDFALRSMKNVIELLDGRSLCLFTSIKNLRFAENYFAAILPKHIKILSQEKLPKQKIIDTMKSDPNHIILGTKSFFTGIDIQGPNLSAVLIDKFPFPMIGDPVNDYLMDQPRGFHKYSLPEAIITMKQGFGRLNRTATDKGIVAVFDGRLSTAKYKNKIFNSFDFKIRATKNWNDVVEYLKNI